MKSDELNTEAGNILRHAVENYPKTQLVLADMLEISTRQLQNYCNGIFPKYKGDKIKELDKLLGTNVYEIVYEKKLHAGDAPSTFQEQRLAKKNGDKVYKAPLVPVRAQAGYVRAMDQSKFIETMEEFSLPPGVNPIGAIWRYWEVEGDSMEPVFHSGDYILTSQVHQMDWENIRNFYLYVVVTDEKVLFKRVAEKNNNKDEWVLISENEDQYDQILMPISQVRELWVFRRQIVNHAPPTKVFKIKV